MSTNTISTNNPITIIANELGVKSWQIEALDKLFKDDATVPFIARYRKEATGGLDEVEVLKAKERFTALAELEKRRTAIIKSLDEREILTDELKTLVTNAQTMSELEDIYLPYKQKRRTRATIAKEKGLEPLANMLLQQSSNTKLYEAASSYINTKKGVKDIEEALAGASDIIAEIISEDITTRGRLRDLFNTEAVLSSTLVKKNAEKGAKFKDYFDWSEKAQKTPSHRMLAIFRGENEEILRIKIRPEQERSEAILSRLFIKNSCTYSDFMHSTLSDSYTRLLAPSLENELRAELKEKADREAVNVFAQNLRELLMSAPLGSKRVLAIDPGVRTGCKTVYINERGDLIDNTVIYPDRKPDQAEEIIRNLIKKHSPEAIAIGNGTYGRETEAFIRSLKLEGIQTVLVSESGASIYSASETAREEFPDYDLTVRGAVSIGRRLMDPLSELVKIDPKSIGVGQYQHDVDQTMLKESLDSVVISCVNGVGVELNTASKELLTYVSGLGKKLAENIIKYRKTNGKLTSRKELLKVPRLGAKAYEQAAGFIRVSESKNPLDKSAVHPESYKVVEQMAKDQDCKVEDLLLSSEIRSKIDLKKYVTEKTGLPTLQDIIAELAKPGRDPREQFVAFSFSKGVNKVSDLKEGMELPGIVTNVTNFGAFVDIGVHQDGLVHISQLANKYVSDPNEIVKVQQQVKVKVLEIDLPRNRISLTMKS